MLLTDGRRIENMRARKAKRDVPRGKASACIHRIDSIAKQHHLGLEGLLRFPLNRLTAQAPRFDR